MSEGVDPQGSESTDPHSTTVRIVPQQEHAGLLTFSEALEAVYQGYRDRADYQTLLVDEPRERLIDPDNGTRISNHFGISPSTEVGGATLHAQYPESDTERQEYQREGKPARVIYDTASAQLRAVILGEMSGTEFPSKGVMAFPTALEMAVGTDVLARDDASVLGIFGSGRQAKNNLVAHDQIRDLDAVRVFSPTKEHRETFKEEMTPVVDAEIETVGGPEEVISGADMILTATNASSPVFDGELLEPGQHVTSIVGSDIELPQAGQAPRLRREIDNATIERADHYVANSIQQAQNNKQGDFIYPMTEGIITWDDVIDLPDIIGERHPGRENSDQITVYKQNSIQGVTLQALASRLLDEVEEQDLGTEMDVFAPEESTRF